MVYRTNVGVYVSVCIFTGIVHAECNGYGDDQAKKCMEDYIYMVAVRELLNRDPHRRISKLEKSKVGPKAGDTIKRRKRRKGREKKRNTKMQPQIQIPFYDRGNKKKKQGQTPSMKGRREKE